MVKAARDRKMEKYKFNDLVAIMKKLRDPNGCPWDREQTHQSLKTFLIEECYELLSAIDTEDMEKVKEELGDLFLQIVFHSRIAEERGAFNIEDVIDAICRKLIRRHPHVFAGKNVRNSDEVKENWERIKEEEGKRKVSIIDDLPKGFPSLLRAYFVTELVSRVGFDWEKAEDILEKLQEEISELREAIDKKDRKRIEKETGDLLLTTVNIARFLEVNPEDALRQAVERFICRFRYIEDQLRRNRRDIKKTSPDELNLLWEEAKHKES